MNTIIVYATYSNSTYEASEQLKSVLEANGHSVTLQLANETTVSQFSDFNLVVFASPSWDYQGLEGQPHEDFNSLLESLASASLPDLKYAILGTGDTNYTHFCGAVDVIAKAVSATKAKQLIEPLKIDQYYMDESGNKERIVAWAEKLVAATK